METVNQSQFNIFGLKLNSMANKTHILKFRAVNKNIFAVIKSGEKPVETRAATDRYRKVAVGDTLTMVCGKDRFNKKVAKVTIFKTVVGLARKYKPQLVHHSCKTAKELTAVYNSFPGYKEKIAKQGIVAWELK